MYRMPPSKGASTFRRAEEIMDPDYLKPFNILDPAAEDFDKALGAQLLQVKRLEEERTEWRKVLRQIGLWGLLSTTAVFVILTATGRLDSFLIAVGKIVAILAFIAVVNYIVIGGFFWLTRSRARREAEKDNPFLSPRRDERYREYVQLLGEMVARNERAVQLNRLVSRLARHQLPKAQVPVAIQGLSAMRTKDHHFFARLEYYKELAKQGPLGSIPTLQSSRDLLWRHHVRRDAHERQEVDNLLIATLEVDALDASRRWF